MRVTDGVEYLLARSMPEPNSGCWLWTIYTDDIGYGRASLAGLRENKAHRIAWTLCRGPIPAGMKVLHRCDTRCCVNPDHLFLGTQADNVADMTRKGRGRTLPRFGSKNPMARLDEDQVWAIRAMLGAKMFSQIEVARSYGVSPATISRIANNQTWREAQ
jgi:hypothetical protein